MNILPTVNILSTVTLSDVPLSDYSKEKEEKAIKEATEKGFNVIRADFDTLLVDLDNEEDVNVFNDNIEMIENKFGIRSFSYWNSKSGYPHIHVKVQLGHGVDNNQRTALELALGSDPKRGILNVKKTMGYYQPLSPSLLLVPPNAIITEVLEKPFFIKM